MVEKAEIGLHRPLAWPYATASSRYGVFVALLCQLPSPRCDPMQCCCKVPSASCGTFWLEEQRRTPCSIRCVLATYP